MTPPLRRDRALGVDYVEVDDEPDHIAQFRNALVRVYLATIEPGTCTLYHRHRVDTLYIVLSEGTSTSEEPGNQRQRTGVGRSITIGQKLAWWAKRRSARAFRLPTGTVLMQYHAECPLTHRLCAASANDQAIRMVGVEMLTDRRRPPGRGVAAAVRDAFVAAQAPPLAGLPIEFHDGHVTVYRIELTHGQRTDRIRALRPSVLVIVSGTAEHHRARSTSGEMRAPGTVRWLNAEEDFALTNGAAAPLLGFLVTLTGGGLLS